MARKSNATRIGAFIVGGLILAVVAIGFFGGSRIFEPRLHFVCYFEGTVNGLSIGSPVKARGVSVGSVFDMRLRYRQRPNDRRLPVFIEIRSNRLAELGVPSNLSKAMLSQLVDQGLRARLDTESLITGQLYVDLDFHPETEAHFAEVEQHGKYPEIPTVPSRIEQLGRTLNQLVAMVTEADIPGVMHAIRDTTQGVNRLVTSPGLSRALDAVPPALTSVGRAADRLGEQVAPLGSSVQGAALDIRRATNALNGTLVDTRALVAPEGATAVRIDGALESVERAAHSVQELADFLRRNPNALIVGKKR
jgi:paraquat-inducible protein B